MPPSETNLPVPLCRIELFGGLRVKIGEQAVRVTRERKAADLLAYLAYSPHIRHPRERLQEALWPDAFNKDLLNLAVSRLGKCLEPEGSVRHGVYLYSDRSVVALNGEHVTSDVAEFEEWLKSAQHADQPEEKARCLESAIALYRGELLPEVYEEWVGPERRRWEEATIRALQTLIPYHSKAQRYEEALEFARRLVAIDTFNEAACQQLLLLHALTGGFEVALRYASDLNRNFSREGLTLSEATRKVIRQIEQRAAQATPSSPELAALIATEEAATSSPAALVRSPQLEPTGGAVPLDSQFYITRPTDEAFRQAIARQDSIVVVKGPRQTGKTSLLARGLHHARSLGAQIVYTDLHLFSESLFESADTFLDALAEAIRDQLDLPEAASERALLSDPNSRFERFLRREVLKTRTEPLVWGLDGVDRLFHCGFGESVFALMRSWHESRALNPDGPWQRLTLAISLSTEPYLYIQNMNQSPFNVGTRLELEDFTLPEVAALNQRYDSPLRSEAELKQFYELLGGHPYLTHQGLHEMGRTNIRVSELSEHAEETFWIFGAHLRSLFGLLEQETDIAQAAREVFAGKACPKRDSFDRLRSAGLLRGKSTEEARPRCALYTRYLLPRLQERFTTNGGGRTEP